MKSVVYSYYENLILGAVEKVAEEFVASSSGLIAEYDISDAVQKELFHKGRVFTDFDGDQSWMAEKAFFDDDLFDMVVKYYDTGWQARLFDKENAKKRVDYLNELFIQAMYLEKYQERKEIIYNIVQRTGKEKTVWTSMNFISMT